MTGTDKSHVAIEEKLCPVCRERHSVGVLLHKQLKQVLPHSVLTGLQLCKEHQAVVDTGRTFFIEIDPEQTTMSADGDHVSKEGHIFFLKGLAVIRNSALEMIIDAPLPPDGFAFCDTEAFNVLTQVTGAEFARDDHEMLNPPKRHDA